MVHSSHIFSLTTNLTFENYIVFFFSDILSNLSRPHNVITRCCNSNFLLLDIRKLEII